MRSNLRGTFSVGARWSNLGYLVKINAQGKSKYSTAAVSVTKKSASKSEVVTGNCGTYYLVAALLDFYKKTSLKSLSDLKRELNLLLTSQKICFE